MWENSRHTEASDADLLGWLALATQKGKCRKGNRQQTLIDDRWSAGWCCR
jgi:hypothetical protein